MGTDPTVVDCPVCGADAGESCVFYGGQGAGDPKRPCTKRRLLARQKALGGTVSSGGETA